MIPSFPLPVVEAKAVSQHARPFRKMSVNKTILRTYVLEIYVTVNNKDEKRTICPLT